MKRSWDWGWKYFYSSTFPPAPVNLQIGQSLQKGRVTVHTASLPWRRMRCSSHLGFFDYFAETPLSCFFLFVWAFSFSVTTLVQTCGYNNENYPPFWKAQPCSPQTFISMLASCTPSSCLKIREKLVSSETKRCIRMYLSRIIYLTKCRAMCMQWLMRSVSQHDKMVWKLLW